MRQLIIGENDFVPRLLRLGRGTWLFFASEQSCPVLRFTIDSNLRRALVRRPILFEP